jgi:hypothetical protein
MATGWASRQGPRLLMPLGEKGKGFSLFSVATDLMMSDIGIPIGIIITTTLPLCVPPDACWVLTRQVMLMQP